MIFIFGGAYQGKLDFAKEKFNITDKEVITLKDDNYDFVSAFGSELQDAKIVDKIEEFCYACAKEGVEAREYLEAHIDEVKDKIIISRDVSQGLVPMDPLDRAYREMMGRMMIYLSNQSDQAYRVLAGLGQQIK